jgi:UDP-glucose 4-epimerase
MWLIAGGAGYIGAHVVDAFVRAGLDIVVLDDLSTGAPGRVPDPVPLVRADVGDFAAVVAALRRYGVTGVVHLASKKSVEQSVAEPEYYFRQNVVGTLTLLEAMVAAGVPRLVFSSSAAVYGEPRQELVTETSPTLPTCPYGDAKLMGEQMIRAVARARGLSWVALRYFNVTGAGGPGLGDPGLSNLVPLVLRAVETGRAPTIFGDDYPTPDGTCIRDYIHVTDLARAHVLCARRCESGAPVGEVYNVGRGEGTSVRQIMDAVERLVRPGLRPVTGPRRAGDPARVVGSSRKIQADLGWVAELGLDDMVRSAWQARTHQGVTASI